MSLVDSAIRQYQDHGRVKAFWGGPSASTEFAQTYNAEGIIAAIKGLSEYHRELNPENPVSPTLRALLDLGVCTLRTVSLHEAVTNRAQSLTARIDRTTESILSFDDYLPAQNPQHEPSGA